MSEIDLATLDDSPGSLVAESPAPEVTPEPTVESEPAEAAFDPKALVGGLTPEQRKAVLDSWDLDEITKHERVSGRIGSQADRIAADKLKALEKQQQGQQLTSLQQRAREQRDPTAALEYVDAEAAAQREAVQTTSWEEATQTYEFLKVNPLTEPLLEGITGKDYGALANGNGALAAMLFESDMARNFKTALPRLVESVKTHTEAALREQITQEVTARLEKQYESEVRPALVKEARAKAGLDLPLLDSGNGTAPSSAPEGDDAYIAGIARGSGPLSREQMRRGAEMLGITL